MLPIQYVIDHLIHKKKRMLLFKHWNPSSETLQQEIDAYLGSYEKQKNKGHKCGHQANIMKIIQVGELVQE